MFNLQATRPVRITCSPIIIHSPILALCEGICPSIHYTCLLQMILQLLCLLLRWSKIGEELYEHLEALHFWPCKVISNSVDIVAISCKVIWPYPRLLPLCYCLHDLCGLDLGNIRGLGIILQGFWATYQGILFFNTFLFLVSECTYGAAAQNSLICCLPVKCSNVYLPCSLQTAVCYCIASFHQRKGKHGQGRLFSMPIYAFVEV